MTLKFSSLAIAAAAMSLAACSSSDSGGGPTTDLSSPTVVAKQVSSIVATASSVGSATGAKTLQNGQCDSGSMSDINETGVNVGSPYTSQGFDLFGTSYSNCRLNDEQSNDYFQFNGVSKGGFVETSNGFVDYFTLGQGGAPLSFTLHSEEGGFTSDSTFNFTLRLHEQDLNSGDYESQLFLMYDGMIGTGGGNFGFNIRFGEADSNGSRFVVGETASGVTLNGSYTIDLDDLIDQQLQCSGTASIATGSPLVVGSSTLFDAGQVTLSSGGASATVTFNANDTVTIQTASGTTTMSQSELQSEGAECAGFYGAGLLYIQ